MSRTPFARVLTVAWIGIAAGLGAAETPDPEAATEARVRAVGELFGEAMISRWEELPAREGAQHGAGEFGRHWQAVPECAVPDGALPLSAVALAAAWEELGGEPAALATSGQESPVVAEVSWSVNAAPAEAEVREGAEEPAGTPELETVRRMRALGAALRSWRIDNLPPLSTTQSKTPPGAAARPGDPEGLIRIPPPEDLLELSGIENLLQGDERWIYLHEIPQLDAWGQPLEVWFDLDHLMSLRVLTIRSVGRDGEADGDSYLPGPFADGDERDDIVLADERFVRWPAALPEAWVPVVEAPERPGVPSATTRDRPEG